VGRSSLHALLKPPSFIYAASRAEEFEKLAKFASSSETWASAADKLEEDIYAACELLSKNPHVGHKRPDLTDEPVRFWPIRGQYLVIYLPDIEPLKIVRILHGARDASPQLQ
jgi:plasmid stabilization system protein ParE